MVDRYKMGQVSILGFLLCLTLSPVFAASASYDDVRNLLTDFISNSVYDKRIRPVVDQSQPVIVKVRLSLVAITNIDEVKESMSTAAYLYIEWTDENLNWIPSMYGNLTHVYVQQSDIWKPDLALQNGFSKLRELGDGFILLTAEFDGRVTWKPFEVFETQCSIDIRYFPFDYQKCNIVFGVWESSADEIKVQVDEMGGAGLDLYEYQENGQWDVVSTSWHESRSPFYTSIVTFTITMRRKPLYVMVSVVFPILMLSILSACTFLIPIDSGERMGYSTTLYLAFAVFLTTVSTSLPESATLSVLATYLVVLITIGTAIIITTAIQIRVHHWDSSREIPRCLRRLVRISRRLQCRRSASKIQTMTELEERTNQNDAGSANETAIDTRSVQGKTEIAPLSPSHDVTKDDITWPDVTSSVDFFCFWMFLVVLILSAVVIFVSGYIESDRIKLK